MIEYGIQNEKSDYRVHVGFLAKCICAFSTKAGVEAIENAKNNGVFSKTATQPGVGGRITSRGYAIPIPNIKNIIEALIPSDIFEKYKINQNESTSNKGSAAVLIVRDMLKRGLIPLSMRAEIIDDENLQIDGYDIIVESRLRIQVKCDFRCGSKSLHPSATGNVYLQTEEWNPLKMH